MPFIYLWLDENVQKPFCQTLELFLLEQLESFVNFFPRWMGFNWKMMLLNWVSSGHSTPWVRHTLVGSGIAWWDLVRKRCGIILCLNRWLTSIWQQPFVQWHNCFLTDPWRHPALIWRRLLQVISSWDGVQLTIQRLYSMADLLPLRRLSGHRRSSWRRFGSGWWKIIYHSGPQERNKQQMRKDWWQFGTLFGFVTSSITPSTTLWEEFWSRIPGKMIFTDQRQRKKLRAIQEIASKLAFSRN